VLSRRELFARAAALGTGGMVVSAVAQSPATRREPLETLTPDEADILNAITARLIPSDGDGPGAQEARATQYIDRALGGALSLSLDAYRSGLAAVDAYAVRSRLGRFVALSPADQDAVLTDMETGKATGFTPNAPTFFNLVRTHTIQGTFCDPYYGGNANFAGWDLIGYPGVRLGVAADDQRMDRRPTPVRRSAYDHVMFLKKKPARAAAPVLEDPWLLS
jgi:gluconate 2-dehydrogenase gamma chain